MKDHDKYFRQPFSNIQGDFRKDPKYYASPDGMKNIIISHCWEYRMGANACLFHLIDNDKNIIEDFTPFTTNGKVSWNEKSNICGISIGEKERGIIIMDTELHKFALIKTDCRDFKIENNTLMLFISQKEIDLLNRETLYSGGTTELPRVKFERPEDIYVELDSLKYFKKKELPNIYNLSSDEKIEHLPIQNGFWEFKGRVPTNTYDGFNNRDFEVYQLEAFAKYGDEQSIEWLNEIKAMKDRKFDRWAKVSYYLGYREKAHNK